MPPHLSAWNSGGPTVTFTSERDPLVAYLRALEHLTRVLAAYPGKKSTLMFSEGYDSNRLLHPDPFHWPQNGMDEMMSSSERAGAASYGWPSARLVALAKRVPQLFASADCQLYTVAIGPPRSTLHTGTYGRGAWSCRAVLSQFAEETGGKLFTDYKNMQRSLDRIIDRTASYYLLGYRPPQRRAGQEGKYHRLKVVVSRKGTRAYYRRGYFDHGESVLLSLDEKNAEIAAVLNDRKSAKQIQLRARAVAYPDETWGSVAAVVVEVPIGQFGGQRAETLLELYGFAMSAAGTVETYFHGRHHITPADRATAGIRYADVLPLRAGSQYRVQCIVRDERTGEIGADTVIVHAPPYSAGLALAPPVLPLIRSGSESIAWTNQLGIDPQRPFARLGVVGTGFPVAFGGKILLFDTAAKACAGERRPVLLRVLHQSGDGMDIDFTLRLLAEGVGAHNVPIRRMEIATGGAPSAVDYLVEVDIPRVDAGRYSLVVAATDASTGATAQSQSEIEVGQ